MAPIAPADSPARRRLRRGRDPRPGEPFPLNRRARRRLPFKHELQTPTMVTAVVAATVLGAVVRLVITRGLSLDEVLNVDQAQSPFGRLMSHLVHRGTQPPLHPALLWLMIHLFGNGDLAVRLVSLLAGVALVPAIGWLTDVIFDRRTAILAALYASVAPVLVWYSQEAGGYILVALFGTLSLVGAALVFRRGRPGDWALHAVAASAAVWADWSGIFIVLAAEFPLLAGLIARRRRRAPVGGYVAAWALDTLALAVQLVPLGLLFAAQLHAHHGLAGTTGVSASRVTFYSVVSNISWALFGFHPAVVTTVLAAVWPLAMLASLLLVGRGVERTASLLLACTLIPLLGVLAVGLVAPGCFDVRYFVAAVPPATVLLARMTSGWPRSRLGLFLVAAGVTALLAGALVDQKFNTQNPRRFEYAQAFAQVRRDGGGTAAVLLAPGNLRVVAARVAPGLRTAPLTLNPPTPAQVGNVFVVKSFSNRPALQHLLDRNIGALRATRHLVSHRRFPGVTVWQFR